MQALADRALLPLALLFLAAGFVVAPEPVWAAMFYAGGLPLLAWRVVPRMAPRLAEPAVALPLLLVGWMALALLWSDRPGPDDPSRLLWLWNCLCTAAFFLNLLLVAGPAAGARAIEWTLIGAGTLNALGSIARFLAMGGTEERMGGWAETRHPILGAGIIGLCLVLALARAMAPGCPARRRAALLAAVAVMAGFVWLTGSRGPLAAVAIGGAVLLGGLRRAWQAAIVAACVLAVALARLADPTLVLDVLDRMTERGWSNRLDIWRQSLAMIGGRPLFGHGLTALLPRAQDAFPHDLYLSTLLYGGAVGLALLLASFALAARGVWRLGPGAERRTLVALGLTACLVGATDLSQVVKGPGPMWYIVWLPLVLAIAAGRRATNEELR